MFTRVRKILSNALTARYLHRESRLSPDMRRQIIQFMRQVDYLPEGEHTAQLLGYRVAYRGAGHLRYLFREIFMRGDYYFESDNAQPTIIDCGSNIGISVLFFKRLFPQCRIIAFEP